MSFRAPPPQGMSDTLARCTNHNSGHDCACGTPTEITIKFVARISGFKVLALGKSKSPPQPYHRGKEYDAAS